MKRTFLVMISIVAVVTVMFSYGCPKSPKDILVGTEEERAVEAKPEVVPAPAPAPVMEKPTPMPVTMMAPSSHRVAKGECLWVISGYKDIYNDPFEWPLIYKANKNQLKDPDLIFPGQDLQISRDNTEREKTQAIKFAKTRGPWSLWDGKVLKYSEMSGFSEE